MWIQLKNGRSLYFRDAKTWKASPAGRLQVLGKADKLLATFSIDAVACWYFDDVDATTYSPNDELHRLE